MPKQEKPQAPAAKPKRALVDWDRIEPGFRAGVKSVLQLAADYQAVTGNSVSHTAINKHFKDLGITRDLAAKVQAKAEALVSAAAVSTQVSATGAATNASDAAIINANADLVATVMLSQRKDIGRGRALATSLLYELEGQTVNIADFEKLGALMYQPDDKGRDKLNDTYMKVISSAGRIDSMKKLADTMKTLVALEREAYGINAEHDKPGTYEDDLDDL